jgi:hypothetical protein
VAKIGMFGRETEESGPTPVGSATAEKKPADAEAEAAHERTQTRLANRERLAATQREDTRTEARTVTEPVTAPVVDRDRDGVDDRVQPQPKIRARSSLMATLALLVGVTAVYAALTGPLAPVAVALGAVGMLLSITGLFAAARRPRVAGSGLAALALLLSVGGAVLGVLAMLHTAAWLDSDVDQVGRWRDWLNATLPFIRTW